MKYATSLSDTGKAVVLMPLSQYKRNELYRHVESFELADPKMFEDAVITNNLCICVLTKDTVDKYSGNDLILSSCDQTYIEYYRWNVEHNIGLSPSRDDKLLRSEVNTDLDFVEGYLLYTKNGGGFTTKGFGYRYNVEYSKDDFPTSGKLHIRFKCKKAKDNFCKYAYNYNGDKTKALSTLTVLGCNSKAASNTYYFSIPQIDWEKISDHPLWNTDIDAAVLDTMNLKWNEENTCIVKK